MKKNKTILLLAHLACVASLSLLTFGVGAQTKSIRMIIAFPPGGPVDFVARSISETLGKELGQTVIVENKPGANGIIAAEYVIKSPPDGSVLWFTSAGAVAINPGLYPKLPYNPITDLAPISLVSRNDELLVVNPNNPATGPKDFIENAMKQRTTMASSGMGSVPHLAAALLGDATKAQLVDVPYKGAAPAITDVMAGHVDAFFGDVPGLINNIRAGKLKPIAMAADARHPLLPEIKTFKEIGIEGVDSDNWYALFTAKGTPQSEITRINQAVIRTLNTESVKQRLLNSGTLPASSTPEQLGDLLKKDADKWARVIREKNIKPD
ncbi:MAG: tripartite tricarboxylate transporter substrate binding protein [Sheuella sp.]|nr:tripartite tricarboxylate transporter substrate binding protein [Sheuella sp.]